ncbi:MAG: CHAD domain-containing protein [Nocardioidaceae bacterium]
MGSGDPAGRQAIADPVLDYISGQVARLHDAEGEVRASEPDGVHNMRVAVRRLRTALVVYGSMFGENLTELLAGELRWLGQTLAPSRDLEVIGDRLVAAMRDDPRLGAGDVPGHLARPLAQAQEAARDQLIEALDSSRSQALQHALSGLRPEPPGAARGVESHDPDLRQLADSTWSDLRTRATDAASASPASHERDTALHELRKAAKRVRYALELVTRVDDERRPEDRRTLDALRDLQRVLGEHHDTVATREWLGTHPPSVAESRESAAHTRLLEHERLAAQRCEQEYESILRQVLPD